VSNSTLTPSVIANEALFQLENNLVAANNVHREYKKEFVKVGDTVTIRKPVKFTASDGATRVQQDVVEGSTTVVINKRKHVSWAFSSQDMTLTIEEYSERYITPAMIALGNQVDLDVLGLYQYVPNWVGTPGQVVDSFADFALGPKRLDKQAVPREMRRAILSPDDNWGLVGNQTVLYNPGMIEGAYREASLGRIGGCDTFMDQNVRNHTTGARGGTPLVNGASQVSTYASVKTTNTQNLVIDGASNSITGWAKAGDVFTIADVYAVNPVSGETLDYLQEFVVTADANSDGSGNVTLVISPAIIISGAYKTASAAPANNAALTFKGSAATAYTQSMVFHKNAFALVTVPLEMPDGVTWKARQQAKGLSVRVVKDYDIDNDEDVIRLDILYGVKAIYPELATRLSGTA
jgi:hypothetical protein